MLVYLSGRNAALACSLTVSKQHNVNILVKTNEFGMRKVAKGNNPLRMRSNYFSSPCIEQVKPRAYKVALY